MQLAAQCRNVLTPALRNRHFHTALPARALPGQKRQLRFKDNGGSFDDEDIVEAFHEAKDNGKKDATSAGHLQMRRDRRVLYYMRLIENEVPQLVGELLSR